MKNPYAVWVIKLSSAVRFWPRCRSVMAVCKFQNGVLSFDPSLYNYIYRDIYIVKYRYISYKLRLRCLSFDLIRMTDIVENIERD